MVKFQQPGSQHSNPAGMFTKGEKIKLIAFGVGALLCMVALLIGIQQSGERRATRDGDLPAVETPVHEDVVYVPEVDAEALGAMVSDAQGADRVLLELDAVQELMRSARQMTANSYRVAGAPEIDGPRSRELAADPSAHRGKPFFARGWVDKIEERGQGVADDSLFLGRLELEDGGFCYFVTAERSSNSTLGDFARVNGFLLKAFSAEHSEEDGEWVEAPLLVGRTLMRSYPAFGPVTELTVGDAMRVDDDDVGGISGLPFMELHKILAYARDLPADAVDWNEAPELNKTLLEQLRADGSNFRFQPFRIPASRLQAITVKEAGENPARLDAYTEGWVGNTMWKHPFHFVGPFEYDEPEISDLVSGRGFFFKNYAYEPMVGGVNVTPVFILTNIDPVVVKENPILANLGYVVAGVSVGLIVFLSFLLTRDKRSSQQLQQRLVQRRRARREATA